MIEYNQFKKDLLFKVKEKCLENNDKISIYLSENHDEIDKLIKRMYDKYNGNVESALNDTFIVIIDKMLKLQSDSDYLLDNVYINLINYERNKELIQDLPYKKVLDLVMILKVLVFKDDYGVYSFKLNNKLLETFNISISVDEIFNKALLNTERLFQCKINTLNEFLTQATGQPLPDTDFSIVTNAMSLNGASTILYRDTLETLANKFNGDLILLPSSIHEFIVSGYDRNIDSEFCRKMVKDVNDEVLSEEEILSYNVYIYCRDTKELKMWV